MGSSARALYSTLLPHTLLSPSHHNASKFCKIPSISYKNINSCGSKPIGSLQIRAMSDTLGSKWEDKIKKTVTDNPVVVYSKTWCSYSAEVKSLFRRLGVEARVIELDELEAQGTQLQSALEKVTGQRTVPNVFIGGKHIGGCSETVQLHQKKELEPLLAGAGAKKV